jgi:protocatechuate 3,4-dioxygenase beta subunit
MKNRILKGLLIASVMTVCLVSIASTQTGPGFPLSASVDSTGTVLLSWAPPSNAQILAYHIYRAPVLGTTTFPDSADYRLIDSVDHSATRYLDQPSDSAAGFSYVVFGITPMGAIRSSFAFAPRFSHGSEPAIYLEAHANMMAGDPTFRVELGWKLREGVSGRTFVIWRAPIQQNQDPRQSSFQAIDTVRDIMQTTDRPPVESAPGFAYVVELVPQTGDPARSNIAIVFHRTLFQFPLSARIGERGQVLLEWFPVHDSLTVEQYYIRRSGMGDGHHGSLPPVIDSISGISKYVDTPPVGDDGGSIVYHVTARIGTGALLHSFPAAVYFHPKSPPATFRLEAEVVLPDTVKMKWEHPDNVSILKYYILTAFTQDPLPVLSPSSIRAVDSTTDNRFELVAPSGSLYGVVAVMAVTTEGRLIPSNGVPVAFAGAVAEPPRLHGVVTDTGSVKLHIRRPSALAGQMAYIYRHRIDTPSVITAAVPWVLIDSTTQEEYLDIPTTTQLGFVYIVRMRAGGRLLESNPYAAILQQRIYLALYPDLDGTIRLEWAPVLQGEPEAFVVWRQVLRDSTMTVDQNGGTAVDTVRGHHWKDRPGEADAFKYAYKVTELRTGVASRWRDIRWNRVVAQPFLLGLRTDIHGKVRLSWTSPFQVPPHQFHVFRAALNRNSNEVDTTLFALIDSVPGTRYAYEDEPPQATSNAFAYRVHAVTPLGTIARTNPVAVVFPYVLPDRDHVTVTSDPVRSGKVGESYLYKPTARSSETSAALKWLLIRAPQGMSIDSVTGRIDWLPFSRGLYRVILAAVSDFGGKAVQEYTLGIAAATGTVSGSVVDMQGRPIPRMIVRLFKRDAETPFQYVRVTDSTGQYHIDRVETGSYVAYAVDPLGRYMAQWWFAKSRPAEADKISVADSAETLVNFAVESRTRSEGPATVAGAVTDTNGIPIEGAVVLFGRVEFMLNSAKHVGSGSDRGENLRDAISFQMSADAPQAGIQSVAPIVATTTGASGEYTVTLSQGAYIGIAYAPGYRKVFYSNTTDLLRAKVLRVQGDTTGIAFALPEVPDVPLASISGAVLDTNGTTGVQSRVLAFRLSGDLRRVDSYFADSDENGAYSLTDLPPGDYVLFALPLGQYAPSFYSLTGATIHWREASRLAVKGSDIGGITILVRPLRSGFAGFTSIDGAVTETSPSGRTLRTFAAGVDGSIVYAMDAEGDVAGYAVTDESGIYSIPDLAPGTYTVTTDRFGYDEPTSVTVSPTYDAEGNPVSGQADFAIASQTTSVEDPGSVAPTTYSLGQNYPNPFNPATTFSFSIPVQDRVTISIYNILGQRVATLVENVLPAGTHTALWDGRTSSGSHAATGVYFYSITSGSFTATKRMVPLK